MSLCVYIHNKLVMKFVNRVCAELVVDLHIYKVFFKANVVTKVSVVLYGTEARI